MKYSILSFIVFAGVCHSIAYAADRPSGCLPDYSSPSRFATCAPTFPKQAASSALKKLAKPRRTPSVIETVTQRATGSSVRPLQFRHVGVSPRTSVLLTPEQVARYYALMPYCVPMPTKNTDGGDSFGGLMPQRPPVDGVQAAQDFLKQQVSTQYPADVAKDMTKQALRQGRRLGPLMLMFGNALKTRSSQPGKDCKIL